MISKIFNSAFVILLSLTIISCNEATNDRILIGATLDLSGPNAVYGNQVKEGANLAISEINMKNGILGEKININYLDSKSEPKLAITNAQQLISIKNCKILIGEISSNATQALIPVVEQNNVFLFAPASSGPKLTGISKNFARNWPSSVSEAASAAKYARNNFAAKTAAVIYVNSEYGKGLKEKFMDTFKSIGGEIVSTETYSVGETDFKTLLLKIKNSSPDCIYLAGNPKEMGVCIKQIRDNNFNSDVVSNTGFLQPDCLNVAGDDANGVVVPTPEYNPKNSNKKSVSEFYKKFMDKYNKEPTMVNANAYDAIFLIKEAIEEKGKAPLEIAKHIRNRKNYKGAAGKVDFTDGDVEVEIIYKEIINGKAVKIEE